jgi:hypothetical protein
VIRGSRAILGTVAFIAVTVIPSQFPQVASALANPESVIGVCETHTYGDLLLKIHATSPSQLSDFITPRIKTVEGVTGSQVVSILEI